MALYYMGPFKTRSCCVAASGLKSCHIYMIILLCGGSLHE